MPSPLSTRFGVAVHVSTLLSASAPSMTSSEQLALSVDANPVHVRRVLSALSRAELVRSRPGPSGGWELTRAPERITLADIHAAVAGDEPALGLHEAATGCHAGQRIQAQLEAIERSLADTRRAELARTTVADMVQRASVDASWRPAAA